MTTQNTESSRRPGLRSSREALDRWLAEADDLLEADPQPVTAPQ
ncbi:MAG TPA: hypothetical protein VG435_06740 [Acidimicrobiales bacterium]|jgi:hypothetical protein|nr:hypothetical protein [Acidimicrobiales bacterium]